MPKLKKVKNYQWPYTPKVLKILKKIEKNRKEFPGQNRIINTWVRGAVIVKEMIGQTFGIHTGRDFVRREIKPGMEGKKLGEFAPTRSRPEHGHAGTR